MRARLAFAVGLVALVNDVRCLTCTEQGCNGGFEWSARPFDDSTIVPGTYELTVVVEGTTHEIVCDIAAGASTSECTEPDFDNDAFVLVDLQPRQVGETWDPDAPIEALRVWIADTTDLRDDDRSNSVRGPEEIDITLRLGTRVLFEGHFEPEYARNETFWGDERCGYCDELVTIPTRWVP